ncbi:MAG: hypothetical protein KGL16_01880 [Acidobacteriota bacterium]|nr:hypothetical protein [Acidobacteriota bacterium]
MFRKLTTVIAAVAALSVAVPAIAQADKGGTPNSKSNKSHPTQSHKCKPHNVAYVESGTIDAATASTLASSNGTWTGTLVVDVTKTNTAAKGDKGKTVTYTFTAAKLRVRFGHGVSALSAGEHVQLIGKLQMVGKKCTPLSPAAMPVINKVIVHAAH